MRCSNYKNLYQLNLTEEIQQKHNESVDFVCYLQDIRYKSTLQSSIELQFDSKRLPI